MGAGQEWVGGVLFGCLLKVEHKREYLSLIKLINFRRLLAGARLARIKKLEKKKTHHADRFDYSTQLGCAVRTKQQASKNFWSTSAVKMQ